MLEPSAGFAWCFDCWVLLGSGLGGVEQFYQVKRTGRYLWRGQAYLIITFVVNCEAFFLLASGHILIVGEIDGCGDKLVFITEIPQKRANPRYIVWIEQLLVGGERLSFSTPPNHRSSRYLISR